MASYLEVREKGGARAVPLEGERITVGQHRSADVVRAGDRSVCRLHAVLERFPTGWAIRDMSSSYRTSNGTFVKGQHLSGECPLRPRDDARVGRTHLMFHGPSDAAVSAATDRPTPPPPLTRLEQAVLFELRRPVVTGDLFTAPPATPEIATVLRITERAR